MCCTQAPGIHSTSLTEGQLPGDKLGAECRLMQFRAATLGPQREENLHGAECDQPNMHLQAGPHCRQATQPNSKQYVASDVFEKVCLYMLY